MILGRIYFPEDLQIDLQILDVGLGYHNRVKTSNFATNYMWSKIALYIRYLYLHLVAQIPDAEEPG